MLRCTKKFICICFVALIVCSVGLPVFAKQEPKVIRVGFFELDGYHMVDDYGTHSGYDYEYIHRMSLYSKWKFEYVGYDQSWSEMQDMLERGEIDFLSSAQKTTDSEARFDFSEKPIGESAAILTVKAGNKKYISGDYANYNGIRVGMIEGNSRNSSFANFAKAKEFSYIPVLFSDSSDMLNALQIGDEIDAVVTSNSRKTDNEWQLEKFDTAPYYLMVKKGNTELLNEINYAIEQIEIDNSMLKNKLHNKYYSIDAGEDIAFTIQEKQLLEQYKKENISLKAMMREEQFPISYFKNGEPKGIVVSIAKEIEKRTGLVFEIIEVGNSEQYQKHVLDDDVAILLDCVADYTVAERMDCVITEPYLNLPFSELSKKDNKKSDGGNKTVAAGTFESITTGYILRNYTAENIMLYDSNRGCIKAVVDGTSDVCYIASYSAEYEAYNDIKNRLVVRNLPEYSSTLSIAVKNSVDPRVATIINKAILSISAEQVNEIVYRETDYPIKAFSIVGYLYSNPLVLVTGLTVFFLLAIVTILYVLILKQQRHEKRRENESLRFISYVSKINDEVGECDLDKMRRYRYMVTDTGRLLKYEVALNSPNNSEKNFTEDDVLSHIEPEAIQELINTRGEDYFECREIDDNGDLHWVSYTLLGLARDYAHPNNLMFIKRDIDRAKREEEEKRTALQDAMNVALDASKAKSNFMSRMSHEIRTPLNAIIGYMTIAKYSSEDKNKIEDCISKSEMAAKHLLGIINDVLDMASIESGKMKLVKENIDLSVMTKSLSDIMHAQTTAKQIDFCIDVSEIVNEVIIGDPLRLKQIIMNLLSNAIKFTPNGGQVTLTIKQTSIRKNKVHVSFIVSDNGIGMDEQFKTRLFLPFEQQDATVSHTFGGTGLGLSICKNFTTLMDGSITVDSVKNEGTTFTVQIPFDVVESNKNIVTREYLSKLKCLVIDDESDACEYMSILLNRCGVLNKSVNSGSKAIELLSHDDSFDFFLMDWKMPNMDGLETLKEIREKLKLNTPVVIVSAYDYSMIRDEAVGLGETYFITKPIFQSSMLNLLMKVFEKSSDIEPKVANDYNFSNKRALVVEDNEMNLEIACELLNMTGIVVECAHDGEEAVEKFANSSEGHFDVILMDVIMPKKDGYQATREIRESSHLQAKTIPILAMTANAFDEDVSLALSSGMSDHISKPIDIDQMFSCISRYIN